MRLRRFGLSACLQADDRAKKVLRQCFPKNNDHAYRWPDVPVPPSFLRFYQFAIVDERYPAVAISKFQRGCGSVLEVRQGCRSSRFCLANQDWHVWLGRTNETLKPLQSCSLRGLPPSIALQVRFEPQWRYNENHQ